ncbi:alpha/beta fold hydrolase [Mucilaginibacter myungsuensis]|uniref:Alpha/beta hydrolase n=1 Tax=Mucilaginibacter myungsuensis TaxID=649104 RepID=A0A929PXL8_9SPHI|nr:alpha/beta hydrolase [Mucilaginibacter myungsuensis]MBE9663993.1 alpha/beta hydrolase [Mucilaginibacter myungsuensis]MDN3601172.1 alpha/beta hydrolase [Mucilaginibacter myungsuensis]
MKTLTYLAAVLMVTGLLASCDHKKTVLSTYDPNKIIVRNNGVEIAYTDTGMRSDTALLFVHGWAINKSYWQDQRAFFEKNYRVIAMDLPGFGESGKDRNAWDTKTFASDVDSVISALKLKKVVLVGHSMSGDIVLQAAVDNPDKVIGLVGVDNFQSPGYVQTPKDKKDYADAMAQMKKHFRSFATQYFNEALFSPTTDTAVRKRILADVAKVDTVIATASMENSNDFDEIDKLKVANQKLFLINSDRQLVDTTHMAKNKIPFKIYYVHGSGHYPMIEHPTQFNEYLRLVMAEIASKKK